MGNHTTPRNRCPGANADGLAFDVNDERFGSLKLATASER